MRGNMFKLRRLGSAFAVVAMATVLAVAVPSSAHAVEPPPPPVADVPVLPSQAARTVSGTASYDGMLIKMWQSMESGTWSMAPGEVATIPKTPTGVATVPKPITAMSTVARGSGAAGVALVGAQIGWAMGEGLLVPIAALSGTTVEAMKCNSPDWYNAVSDFMTMGIATGCGIGVLEPDADQAAEYHATIGGVLYRVWGPTGTGMSGGRPSVPTTVYCFNSVPASVGGQAVYTVWEGRIGQERGGSATGCPNGQGTGIGALGMTAGADGQMGHPGVPRYHLGSTTGPLAATTEIVRPKPERRLSCRIGWEDGSTTQAFGATYSESEGLPLDSRSLGCEEAFVSKPGAGPDLMPSSIDIDSDDGTSITEISSSEVPEFSPTERKSLGNGIRPSRGLVLEKTVNGVTDSCNTWAADCSNWWSDTSNGTTPGTYRCTFAGEAVSLVECGVYRGTFDTKTSTPTITDPVSGTEQPWQTSPNPNTTSPGSGVDPGGECLAEWPSAPDPISWILHPIKCALVWAFVPRVEVLASTQTEIATAWEPTIFGQLPGVVSAALTIPNGGTGCSGPYVSIPINLGGISTGFEGYPLSACEEPMSTLATWARVIGSAVLIWLTGLGIIRRASATVNAPGVGAGAG